MGRHVALGILAAVELATVVYTALAVHSVLANAPAPGSGDDVLVPVITAIAMLAVYGSLTWLAFGFMGDS